MEVNEPSNPRTPVTSEDRFRAAHTLGDFATIELASSAFGSRPPWQGGEN
jgi:hypothetical protein